MGAYEESPAHRYQTLLRLYVATATEEAELSWRRQVLMETLPAELKEPGHWYRFAGSKDLIEVTPDRSGQWHPDGALPTGVDPRLVVDVPGGQSVTLLNQILELLHAIPVNGSNQATVEELKSQVADVGTEEWANWLVQGFQQGLAQVPDVAEERAGFLLRAAQQMAGTELLEGRATGYDVAGVLMVEAIAEQLLNNEAVCRAVLAKAAARPACATAEMAAMMIDDCWYRGLGDRITAALDTLRRRGEQVVEEARKGAYPEGHPEMALDIYYGGILQAVPYLLATNAGYTKLSHAPVGPDERAGYEKKANTSEEKLVRLRTALLYAVSDVDLSQLYDKQARVAAVLRGGDREHAEELVHEIIDLEYFYPSTFRSVLLGTAS
ncbi:MAG: hypothetical protein JSS95_11070 [Acidobacteria bacterium]|nr:hypothetical protein [Acidobacteriota bacterium]